MAMDQNYPGAPPLVPPPIAGPRPQMRPQRPMRPPMTGEQGQVPSTDGGGIVGGMGNVGAVDADRPVGGGASGADASSPFLPRPTMSAPPAPPMAPPLAPPQTGAQTNAQRRAEAKRRAKARGQRAATL